MKCEGRLRHRHLGIIPLCFQTRKKREGEEMIFKTSFAAHQAARVGNEIAVLLGLSQEEFLSGVVYPDNCDDCGDVRAYSSNEGYCYGCSKEVQPEGYELYWITVIQYGGRATPLKESRREFFLNLIYRLFQKKQPKSLDDFFPKEIYSDDLREKITALLERDAEVGE